VRALTCAAFFLSPPGSIVTAALLIAVARAPAIASSPPWYYRVSKEQILATGLLRPDRAVSAQKVFCVQPSFFTICASSCRKLFSLFRTPPLIDSVHYNAQIIFLALSSSPLI